MLKQKIAIISELDFAHTALVSLKYHKISEHYPFQIYTEVRK